MSYPASIQKIESLTPIEGADRIKVAYLLSHKKKNMTLPSRKSDRQAFVTGKKHNLSDGSLVKLFYDVYSSDYIYYSGKEKISNSLRERKIKEKRESSLYSFAKILECALERSVRSEAAYCFNSEKCHIEKRKLKGIERQYLIWSNGCDSKKLGDFHYKIWKGDIKRFRPLKNSYKNVDLKLVKEAFNSNIWYMKYGGKRWAQALEALFDLKESLKKLDYEKIALSVDHILDLQHNTGFLLNKTEFKALESRSKLYPNPVQIKGKMRVRINHLDNRFYLRTIEDYKPFVSSGMKKLIANRTKKI
jgi:hypothetical protein